MAREVSTGILIVSDADVNLAAFQHGRLIGAKSFGAETGTPLVFLQHFRGGLDRSSAASSCRWQRADYSSSPLSIDPEHLGPGKGLPSRAFGHFQRVVRATSTHGTYIKSVAVGAALFQNRTAR